MPFAICSL
uniref:Uncharacterized protein n=1 Tax=Rhizophora mucronata TaxID=61149 RepID=A0A2P2NDI0_RHIMU